MSKLSVMEYVKRDIHIQPQLIDESLIAKVSDFMLRLGFLRKEFKGNEFRPKEIMFTTKRNSREDDFITIGFYDKGVFIIGVISYPFADDFIKEFCDVGS